MHKTSPEVLDLRGLKCPLPVLRTRKKLDQLPGGAVIEVLCTDPMAALDLPHLLAQRGDVLLFHSEEAGKLLFRIQKAGE